MKEIDLEIAEAKSKLAALEARKEELAIEEAEKERQATIQAAKKGKIKHDLWYVSEYTFQERFDEGGFYTKSYILGEPDLKKGDIVYWIDEEGMWGIEDDDILIDSRHVTELPQ